MSEQDSSPEGMAKRMKDLVLGNPQFTDGDVRLIYDCCAGLVFLDGRVDELTKKLSMSAARVAVSEEERLRFEARLADAEMKKMSVLVAYEKMMEYVTDEMRKLLGGER